MENESEAVLERENEAEEYKVADVSKDKRKSYSRERKLEAIQLYHECGNKYKTAKTFGVQPSTLRGWLQNETKIRASSRGTRKVGSGRKVFWPDMESELLRQYRELREKGLKVKAWWFEAKSKELIKDMHPDQFKFSDGWFTAFKKRNKISYRSTTNVSQKAPIDLEDKIREFHQHIRRLAKRGEAKGEIGQYELRDIGNVDQTPLPFTFNTGKGYDTTGTSTVWHRGHASGLEKRQCTVQLCIGRKLLMLFKTYYWVNAAQQLAPGTTSLVQPLDVSVNSEFKSIVERLQNQHMHSNVSLYIEGKITASQRRVLITKWVGQAWAEVCANKDMIYRAFRSVFQSP